MVTVFDALTQALYDVFADTAEFGTPNHTG